MSCGDKHLCTHHSARAGLGAVPQQVVCYIMWWVGSVTGVRKLLAIAANKIAETY